jgi:hypothetical protein
MSACTSVVTGARTNVAPDGGRLYNAAGFQFDEVPTPYRRR